MSDGYKIDSMSSVDATDQDSSKERFLERAAEAFDEATSKGTGLECWALVIVGGELPNGEVPGAFRSYGSPREVFEALKDGINMIMRA